MTRIAVVGTGSWGTAVAGWAARVAGNQVTLWGRDAAKVATLAATRTHPDLGTVTVPATVAVTTDPAALSTAQLVLWGVPTQHSRAIARLLSVHLPACPVVSLAKGLEQGSLKSVCTVLGEELPGRTLATLSGPSHAAEAAAGRPMGLVVAGPDQVTASVVERLHAPAMRLYTTPDLVGVELAGALKNVVAVGAGICEGLGLGDNAKAALITRGLAEMRRLGRCLGARDATFAGLAGIGDLLTTCYSQHGRNRALGLAIAAGENPVDLLARLRTVAEGAWTSRAAVALGQRYGVELPIASAVESVIWLATPVPQAIERLLARAPKEEDA